MRTRLTKTFVLALLTLLSGGCSNKSNYNPPSSTTTGINFTPIIPFGGTTTGQPNQPSIIIAPNQGSMIGQIGVVAFEPGLSLNSLNVNTSVPVNGLSLLTPSGAFINTAPTSQPTTTFIIAPNNTSGGSPGQIAFIPQTNQQQQLSLFANTNGLSNQPIQFTITNANVSSQANPTPRNVPINNLNFPVQIGASPQVATTATTNIFDNRTVGKGTRDVLAQVRLIETTGQGTAKLVRVTAAVSPTAINSLGLTDVNGVIIALAQPDPNSSNGVVFDLSGNPLLIPSGQPVTISIVGDIRNSPFVADTVNAQIRTLQFTRQDDTVFVVSGPADFAGQNIVFTTKY